jgi:hypothetical protein
MVAISSQPVPDVRLGSGGSGETKLGSCVEDVKGEGVQVSLAI